MKTIALTPDTLHRVLTLVSATALPGRVADSLLDFIHETIRNAEYLNDAALELIDSADILNTCHDLMQNHTPNHPPVGLFTEATELQHGKGTHPDPQLHLVYISTLLNNIGATGTTDPVRDAGDLLRDLARALYTPEDEDEQ